MRPFRIRDPIHNFIVLTDEERKAIDAPCYQRLRDIKQLAMTHLVYPGARHSRFEHSLGVRQITDRLAEELKKTDDEFGDDEHRIVRLAALLHDLGHGPFSHVSENVLDDRAGVKGVHEAISVAIIRTNSDLADALDQDTRKAVADLLAPTPARSVVRDIVSGPTDADKLDYLLRDAYYCGVDYGNYDLDRLIDTAKAIRPAPAESYLGYEHPGVWAVEGLLLARHHMHRQVYGHKTRIATDIMIERALALGIEEGSLRSDAYDVPTEDGKPAPNEDFLTAYLTQTDTTVMSDLLKEGNKGKVSYDLAERLVNRRLLRQGASVALHLNRERIGGPRLGRILDRERFAERAPELEQQIANEIERPSHRVALRVIRTDNPTYRLPGSDINEKDILLWYPDKEPDNFQRESEIFNEEAAEPMSFAYLYIEPIEDLSAQGAEELLWQALLSI